MTPQQNITNMLHLSKPRRILFVLISFLIVAFGQPARSPILGLMAATFGYALFWRTLLSYEGPKKRFLISALWFGSIQLIQLSWMIGHPFWYILAPYLLLGLFIGCQFGLIGLLMTPSNLTKFRMIFGMAGLWVIMEWVRLFALSGYSWNPVGMALTGNIYALQMASLFGVFGLSFWVILVNLLFLKAWMQKKEYLLFVTAAFLPFVYGVAQLELNDVMHTDEDHFTAVLVQTAFAVDDLDHIHERKALVYFVSEQIRQILEITKKQQSEKIDLVVLPEYVVPFGTYTTVFPYENIKEMFVEVFGESVLEKLPKLEEHLATSFISDDHKTVTYVNNAYWLQALSNIFHAPVVAGLEDVDDVALNERNHFSAALYFQPTCVDCKMPERYEKRVLVPLGEYIPFDFCRQLAIRYGVTGSFTRGERARVFDHPKTPFGVSICYEETFGHVMWENRLAGAKMLVNLTNDGWFPNSTLTKQHFDHARLRTVECGVPLIRACNTGITGGFDSFGRVVAILENEDQHHETLSDSLLIKVPTYSYDTLYSKYGDNLILVFSFLTLFGLFSRRNGKL